MWETRLGFRSQHCWLLAVYVMYFSLFWALVCSSVTWELWSFSANFFLNHYKGNLVDSRSPFKIIKEYFIATVIRTSPKWKDTSKDQDCPDICCVFCVKSLQLCSTLCHPMDCSPPCSSVQGILQTRILEWIALPSSRHLPNPASLYVSCPSRRVFTTSAT